MFSGDRLNQVFKKGLARATQDLFSFKGAFSPSQK